MLLAGLQRQPVRRPPVRVAGQPDQPAGELAGEAVADRHEAGVRPAEEQRHTQSLGRPDGQRLTRDEMIAQVARIAAAVTVPVTADIEGGYGPGPSDVAATVDAVIAAGAVGVNIEDSRAPGGPLFAPAEQAARIQAARTAAASAGLPGLCINARTGSTSSRTASKNSSSKASAASA